MRTMGCDKKVDSHRFGNRTKLWRMMMVLLTFLTNCASLLQLIFCSLLSLEGLVAILGIVCMCGLQYFAPLSLCRWVQSIYIHTIPNIQISKPKYNCHATVNWHSREVFLTRQGQSDRTRTHACWLPWPSAAAISTKAKIWHICYCPF